MLKSLTTFCFGLACFVVAQQAVLRGQETSSSSKLSDLTPNEFAALDRITVGSVTGTISFLASDELAGRGTLSKEFQIASAYVASRLRGAGATGLGPEGSFFVESTVDTERTPTDGYSLEVPSARAPKSMLLNAVTAPYQFEGKIPLVDKNAALQKDKAGAAVMMWDDIEADANEMSLLRRRAATLAEKNVTALLVVAPPKSLLWAASSQLQNEPKLVSSRGRFSIPIVLISERTWADESTCKLSIPAQLREKTAVRNVVAVIEGSDPQLKSEAVFYSAHLDHLGDVGSGEDKIFNGADDDASGVTAVVTLADAFGALEPKPKRSTIFMAFWGEESGLLGSKQLAEASPWPLEKLVAGINIEMIGRPEEGARNKMWMTGWTESDLGSIVASASRRVSVETFEHPKLSAMLYGRSDNFSFANKGVVAHSFSAGSLHKDYHQASDEWQKLELPHMTQVIRGLFAGTLPIANGELTPSKTTK